MGTIEEALVKIRSLIDSQARVELKMGPFKCTIPEGTTPEQTFGQIMDIAGVKNKTTRDNLQSQIVTILRQYFAEKTEKINHTRFEGSVLHIVMVDLTIRKNENGTVELIGFYGTLEADISNEWLWKTWKINNITQVFSLAYSQHKKN